MTLRINSDMTALIAHHSLQKQTTAVSRSMERMSSGLAINSSKDDPVGMAISEKMRIQMRGLQQAQRNAQDGISLLQTVDGALSQVHSILQRARDLYVQFNSGSIDDSGKRAIAEELAGLSNEIGRLASSTAFGETRLLNSGTTRITLQVGAQADEIVDFAMVTLMGTINSLVNPNDFFMLPFFNPDTDSIDDSIDRVSQARARFGALQNRLEQSLGQLAVFEENLSAAESQVRDVDAAAELMRLTQSQMQRDANLAMMAQGHVAASSLRRLLE